MTLQVQFCECRSEKIMQPPKSGADTRPILMWFFQKSFVDDLAHKKLLGNEVTHSNRSGNTTHYIAHLGES